MTKEKGHLQFGGRLLVAIRALAPAILGFILVSFGASLAIGTLRALPEDSPIAVGGLVLGAGLQTLGFALGAAIGGKERRVLRTASLGQVATGSFAGLCSILFVGVLTGGALLLWDLAGRAMAWHLAVKIIIPGIIGLITGRWLTAGSRALAEDGGLEG